MYRYTVVALNFRSYALDALEIVEEEDRTTTPTNPAPESDISPLRPKPKKRKKPSEPENDENSLLMTVPIKKKSKRFRPEEKQQAGSLAPRTLRY